MNHQDPIKILDDFKPKEEAKELDFEEWFKNNYQDK